MLFPNKQTYDRNELIRALSLALDLSERQPLNHATRTAYVALQIARTMGLAESEVEDIYVAAYLHEIGATTPVCDVNTGGTIWLDSADTGKYLMSKMPFSAKAGDYVLYHNRTRIELGGACSDDIPIGAQVVKLADYFERTYNHSMFYYDQRSDLWEWAKKQRGVCLDLDVIDAFLTISSREKFWLDFTSYSIELIVKDIQPSLKVQLNPTEVEQIANVFAEIIDSKSHFTFNHSHGVADIAGRLAPLVFENDHEIFQMRIAALLHDIGKLAVPTEVLDKPGRLTPREFAQIKSHPYYTKMILGRVRGFETIKEWAGNHHETIDGSGYPEHRKDLTKPERLLALADVFQALTEERPYRPPMSNEQAFEVMTQMATENKLCGECLSLVKSLG